MTTQHILYLGLDPQHFTSAGLITHCPIIEIVPYSFENPLIQKALQNFKEYTHVIFTSKSAIPLLISYAKKAGYEKELISKVIVVVGRATAVALTQFGLKADWIAEEETAEGVVKLLEQLDLKDSWSFWPHSAGSRDLIPLFFQQMNHRLSSCIFYETKAKIPKVIPQLDDYDEVVFTSPSVVDAFLQIYGTLPKNIKLTPIGPVTKKYLSNFNF